MSLKGMMFKVAREMDKQRFQSIKQQEKERKKENFNNAAAIQSGIVFSQNSDIDLVEENIGEISILYDAWVDQYLELERMRNAMDIENEFEDYLENIQYAIALTQCAYEEIELVPEVFELPTYTQQYLGKIKECFLWALKCHIRRNEVILNGFIETIEHGVATENPAELANDFLLKAERYVKSGNSYIHKAIQSV